MWWNKTIQGQGLRHLPHAPRMPLACSATGRASWNLKANQPCLGPKQALTGLPGALKCDFRTGLVRGGLTQKPTWLSVVVVFVCLFSQKHFQSIGFASFWYDFVSCLGQANRNCRDKDSESQTVWVLNLPCRSYYAGIKGNFLVKYSRSPVGCLLISGKAPGLAGPGLAVSRHRESDLWTPLSTPGSVD